MSTTTEPGPHGVPHNVRQTIAATMMESVTADVAIMGDGAEAVGPGNVRIALRGRAIQSGAGQAWSIDVGTAETLLAALPEAIAAADAERDRLS